MKAVQIVNPSEMKVVELEKPAVGVGEAQNAVAQQKAAVAGVKLIFLEFSHAVGRVPPSAVQRAQLVGNAFLKF